ncbi:hypothetical protein IDSA_06780 [Pseudidiomarina salinarum]|uniref:Uncharacterized protein n=1 Tax=Pseudidiomarina salinarum TaxID=435908 RepID=A0A094ISX3_9GAMM|nr:DUF3644 domain-containing protein [Pseudidiomarina salinarum]KFZ30790.1 hypothetical protein IDSA_06780 [Pseudidiomarina salinarum]RUO71257.1 DUF3644 domain-containing protein [Pseudidiomarina salinarum]
MSANERQKKFFEFLKQQETKGQPFTKDDVLKATGWKAATFQSYLAKGQLSDFVSKTDNNKLEASNTLNITFKQFEKKLSQSKHVQSLGHNCKSKLAKALLRKSRDNMLLALELYNRPSLENKIDGFVMLFCAAWEQLLKAILIERDGEQTIYRKSKTKQKDTISLRDGLDRVFPAPSKVKDNVLKITDLRDNAVHLLIPEIQGIASRIFQSGVFNYSSKFEEFCEVPFINTANVGMLSLVGEFRTPPLPMMKTIYGSAAKDMLDLANDLAKSIEDSDDVAFAIPLNVTLQFASKDEAGTQIVLVKAEDGVPGLQRALTIEKSVDAEKTHPYRQTDVIKAINERLEEHYSDEQRAEFLVSKKNGQPTFNPNCFQSVAHKLKWKNGNNKFHHFLAKANTHLYSEAAINTIIEKITSIQGYLRKCKNDYGSRNNKK